MLRGKLKNIIFALVMAGFICTMTTMANEDSQRIKFARGETSTTVAGSIAGGEHDRYLIGGREGQKMSIKISSDEKNAIFQIKDAANGKYLSGAGESDDATEWNAVLPATGDYEIVIGVTRGNANYKLSVAVK